MNNDNIEISVASAEDLLGIYVLIKELAIFEKEPDEPTNSFDSFYSEGTCDRPYYKAYVAKQGDDVVGAAVYYYGYSTGKVK